MSYQPPSALDGSMGRRTHHRHYSLVKLQTTSWKEPLVELLTRLIRIIYSPPQSPQPSVDSHLVINTNDIDLLLWSDM